MTLAYAQNPLDTFPRNFPVDGEVANLLRTCQRHSQQVHNINDKTVKLARAKVRPLCLLCLVVSQIPLQQLVVNLLAVSLTSP